MVSLRASHPPSMIALRCFAAAARTGSFTRAAAELNLTQSAVSRQVAKLEDSLATRLFTRAGPYLQLTERGRAYASAITPPLTAIVAATERFRSELDAGVITLATLPSFGMRWLAPRLTRLTRDLPELVVNLFARSDEFDFAAEIHDAAIHFGQPDWPGVRCDYLFGERCVAVVAPALLKANGNDMHAVLARAPLLTLTNRPAAWEQWAVSREIELVGRKPRPRYEHFAMLAQAAAAGAGAALIPDYLIEEELGDGRLVSIALPDTTSEGAYYLVYPEEKLEKSAFRKFRRWLIDEARSIA
jgi:LysR family transcriptional regulator, glycine cleavage system transcriptional activator